MSTLMPWAMKLKQEKPSCFVGQADPKAPHSFMPWWLLKAPNIDGCFSIFLFIPTYLLKHFGHKKKVSILKLCLYYAILSTEGEDQAAQLFSDRQMGGCFEL